MANKVELKTLVEKMNLKNLTPDVDLSDKDVEIPDINRPALQLTGFFEHFDSERVQIIGYVEYTFLEKMTDEDKKKRIYETLLSYKIPCLIFCRNLPPEKMLLEMAEKANIPVFQTEKKTSEFTAEIIRWLNVELAPCISIHGVLVDVYGVGVLIMGESGIGKSEAALELIKATDTMVVHNPESNMGNACGCPPTMEIVHRGILTGLGTDGYTQDVLESYKVANVLHKHHLCDANAAWSEVPQMLFEGNAKIANRYFKKQLGVLKEGAAADVIVADYVPRTPMDASNINSHILFGMTGRSVVTTVCNGKVLMKDRELIGIDEEKVLYEVREEAKKLERSING